MAVFVVMIDRCVRMCAVTASDSKLPAGGMFFRCGYELEYRGVPKFWTH